MMTSNSSSIGVYKAYHISAVPLQVVLLGYIYPTIAAFTLVSNVIVIYVFTERRKQTATSVFLIALAVTDSIFSVMVVPSFVYLYSLGNYKYYLPYGWCLYKQYASNVYRIGRTASNWFTVSLGLQRYLVVRFPFKAKRLCSKTKSTITVICVCIGATLLHTNLFLAIEVLPLYPVSTVTGNATNESVGYSPYMGCRKRIPPFYARAVGDTRRAKLVYYVISGIFSRLLPCVLLTITTFLLTLELGTKRYQPVNSTEIDNHKRQITLFVFAILVLFLLSEVQDAVVFLIYVYELQTNQIRRFMTASVDVKWDTIGTLVTLIGCQCNMFIYLFMSSQFRDVIIHSFCFCGRRHRNAPASALRPTDSNLTKTTST